MNYTEVCTCQMKCHVHGGVSAAELRAEVERLQEALEEASSFAKWCWNQAKRLTALNRGSPAFDRLRDEGRRVYRLTRAALDGDDHE